jgi:hypothetical protein
MVNLLTHALKYTLPDGKNTIQVSSITMRRRVRLPRTRASERSEIAYRSNGHGDGT